MEQTETSQQIEIPIVPALPPAPIRLFKTSNLLAINPRPFCPEHFGTEYDYYQTHQDPRWKIQQQIRWRVQQGEDGKYRRESNTHFVTWSDGSISLFVGKECFDLTPDETKRDFIFVDRGGVWRSQGKFESKITTHPAVVNEETQKLLSHELSRKYQEENKTLTMNRTTDPEQDKIKASAFEAEMKRGIAYIRRKRKTVKAAGMGGDGERDELDGGAGEEAGDKAMHKEDDGMGDDDDEDADAEYKYHQRPAKTDEQDHAEEDEGEAKHMNSAKKKKSKKGASTRRGSRSRTKQKTKKASTKRNPRGSATAAKKKQNKNEYESEEEGTEAEEDEEEKAENNDGEDDDLPEEEEEEENPEDDEDDKDDEDFSM